MASSTKKLFFRISAAVVLLALVLTLAPVRIHASATVVFLTSGTTWTVPSDWLSNNNTIEVIGAGGVATAGGFSGSGGGGAYSLINNLSLTAGASVGYHVGDASAGDTYFCNSTSNCASISGTAVKVGAKGGGSGASGGAGGAAASGVGTTKYSGGSGSFPNASGGVGGGGAGGPKGNGGSGATSNDFSGSGGGGNGGGTDGASGNQEIAGGAGGNNSGGTGGGSGGTSGAPNGGNGSNGGGGGGAFGNGGSAGNGGNGGNGTEWDSSHGSGGGGGGAGSDGTFPRSGGSGGLYGGGGGSATQSGSAGTGGGGIIVITYGKGVTLTGNVKFLGGLAIIGSLIKGSGTFQIDDPLDPANKILSHSFVESPDAKNIYDGIAPLDKNGDAVIRLPDYFDALNKDVRYQYFPMDQAMPNLYIKDQEHDNQFTIGGGVPNGRVSWQITGIRHDPYIEAHPIVPEVEKGPGQPVNKGECVYPPLCGE